MFLTFWGIHIETPIDEIMLIGPYEYIEAGVLDTLARHCAPKGTPDQ